MNGIAGWSRKWAVRMALLLLVNSLSIVSSNASEKPCDNSKVNCPDSIQPPPPGSAPEPRTDVPAIPGKSGFVVNELHLRQGKVRFKMTLRIDGADEVRFPFWPSVADPARASAIESIQTEGGLGCRYTDRIEKTIVGNVSQDRREYYFLSADPSQGTYVVTFDIELPNVEWRHHFLASNTQTGSQLAYHLWLKNDTGFDLKDISVYVSNRILLAGPISLNSAHAAEFARKLIPLHTVKDGVCFSVAEADFGVLAGATTNTGPASSEKKTLKPIAQSKAIWEAAKKEMPHLFDMTPATLSYRPIANSSIFASTSVELADSKAFEAHTKQDSFPLTEPQVDLVGSVTKAWSVFAVPTSPNEPSVVYDYTLNQTRTYSFSADLKIPAYLVQAKPLLLDGKPVDYVSKKKTLALTIGYRENFSDKSKALKDLQALLLAAPPLPGDAAMRRTQVLARLKPLEVIATAFAAVTADVDQRIQATTKECRELFDANKQKEQTAKQSLIFQLNEYKCTLVDAYNEAVSPDKSSP